MAETMARREYIIFLIFGGIEIYDVSMKDEGFLCLVIIDTFFLLI